MADSARNYTDEELKVMEKYLSGIYTQAEKDLKKKFEKYMADFARLEEGHKKDVAEGKWTQEQFETWRKNKLLYGMHWPKLIEQVQREMVKCNETALKYVNGRIADIFAVNYNQLAEVINDSPVGGYSFELINADTVKNIATSDDIMLPPPRKKLNIPKDERWNAKLVNAQLLQGILQGESIPKMAARMANVCNSNKAAATRTARTMTTAAENSGRQSGINRATADGIILIKEWLATNDERTRDSHAEINHQRVRCDAGNTKKVKFSNGLEFPGDWNGKPAEVYNCRCTLITKYAGVDEKLLKKAINNQSIEKSLLSTKSKQEKAKQEKEAENKERDFKNRQTCGIIEKTLGAIINPSILGIDSELLEASAQQLIKLDEKFNILKQMTKFTVKSEKIESNKQASASSSHTYTRPRNVTLNFSPDFFKQKAKYLKDIRDNVRFKFHMPCKKEDYIRYDATHEYGHLLQRYLLQEEYEKRGWSLKDAGKFINWNETEEGLRYAWYKQMFKEYQKQCKDEILAIAYKNNPKFSYYRNTSRYARKTDGEFFAEVFANSQLGKPNELGLAMQEWLKGKGF